MSSFRIKSSAVFDLFSPSLILFTPFISFINHNEYSYTAPEFWISVAILSAIGLLCGTVMMLGGAWLRVLGTAALVTLFVDLQFDWFDVQREFRIPGFGLGILVLCWLLRDHLSRIIVPAFATMLMTSLILPGHSENSSFQKPGLSTGAGMMSKPAPPALVHLIFDEFIGIEGIPTEVANGPAVRDLLRSFFRTNGFHVFGRAYSRFVRTKNSIPNTLNYASIPENAHFVEGDEAVHLVLRGNKYFKDMHEQGYRIHVYQPDFIDFCAGYEVQVVSCRTFPSRGIQPLTTLQLSPLAKAELILKSFARLSVTEQTLAHYYTLLERKVLSAGYNWPSWWLSKTGSSSVGGMQILDIVAQDVAKARAGDLFFAHLLLPHGPYVYDRTCRPRDPHAWDDRFEGVGVTNSAKSRARRYALYLDQIVCVQVKLQKMVDRWRQAGLYKRMKIIIHGDHGSRIYMNNPTIRNKDRLITSDYIDAFSTMFAVKAPGLEPGYNTRMVAIQDLFAAVAHDRLDQLTAGRAEPYILLEHSYDMTPQAMMPRPMPDFRNSP